MAHRHRVHQVIEESFQFSIQLNRSSSDKWEQLTKTTIGIANTWSISCWVNADDFAASGNIYALASDPASSTVDTNGINLLQIGTGLRLRIHNDAVGPAILTKAYTFDSALNVNVWSHIVVTHDGTQVAADETKLYLDNVLTAPDTLDQDGETTMSDSPDRGIAIGGNFSTASAPSTATWNGLMGPTAIWNVVLDTANINKIFGDKFAIDLKFDAGAYDQSAACKHFWRMSNLNDGRTDRIQTNSIDLDDTVGISIGDLSTDVPT